MESEELELIRAMYGDELQEENEEISLIIKPATYQEVMGFVEFRLKFHLVSKKFSVSSSQGLDDSQMAKLNSHLQKSLEELIQSESDSLLYTFFESAKEIATEINDNVKGECNVCLFDLGNNLAELCRVPGCFHRFHKKCLKRWWFAYDWEIKCPVCRLTLSEQSAEQLVS